jgi:plastocyanin
MRRACIALVLAATAMPLVPGPASGAPAEVGSSPRRTSRDAADAAHVQVHDRYFSPTTVAVPRGGTVVFDFVGDGHHTATDASGLELYDSGLVDGGGPSVSAVFAAAGAYRFTCTPHPSMGGRVEVPVRAAPASGRVAIGSS